MCGIFGLIINDNDTDSRKMVDMTVDGLRRLEYRGYDSTGFCYGYSPIIIKTKGNVDDLCFLLQNTDILVDKYSTHICIAHTRWATHGIPSDINAHPHSSGDDNQFIVVHNGIIQNYKYLRRMLEDLGYRFKSNTDTEVIPLLFKMYYDTGERLFLNLVNKVLAIIDGTYAILIKSSIYPEELMACKKESPLIIGKLVNGYALSSDINALIEHTNQACFLEDGDIVHITPESYIVHNHDDIVTREFTKIDIETSMVLKGEYDHFMEKEIFEQPISIARTLNGYCKDQYINIQEIMKYRDRIIKSTRILFIACGTSLHACIASRIIAESLIDSPISYDNACDFVEREGNVLPGDTCIFVSQSGETADTLQALRYAKSKYAFSIGITNANGSTISREAHVCLYLNAGPEIGVGSTKAYTSQILLLSLLATLLNTNTNKVVNNDLYHATLKLPFYIKEVLQNNKVYQDIAKRIKDEKHILFIGRGMNYATSLEASLKFKEICYIHSEAILSGELKHGPLALIDDTVLCIIFATFDDMYSKNLSTVNQLKSRSARQIVVCTSPDDFNGLETIVVPKTIPYLQGLINIIPFQLLAYYIAKLKNINVDQPRNLAKSVTVTD